MSDATRSNPEGGRRGAEARTAPRIDVRLSAEVRLGGRPFTAVTRNLSVGGVCLECVAPAVDGSEVDVGLFLVVDDVEDASAPPIELKGKVAWSSPGEPGSPALIGLRFEGLSAAQLDGLSNFLKNVAE